MSEKITIKLSNNPIGDVARNKKGEEIHLEEQFILRVSPTLSEKIKFCCKENDFSSLNFTFNDSRKGNFEIDGEIFDASIVDLPTIIESHKIFEGKKLFKMADICQMMLVEEKNQINEHKKHGNLWPHGLCPPLQYVRKRRFRKRISKQAVEHIEKEVERLLREDKLATEVHYEVTESKTNQEKDSTINTPAEYDDEEFDVQSLYGMQSDIDSDSDFANEINKNLENADSNEENDDNEDNADNNDDQDSDDDISSDDAAENEKYLLSESIKDIESTIEKKKIDLLSASNPLIKKRFEDMIVKLTQELELKKEQLDNY